MKALWTTVAACSVFLSGCVTPLPVADRMIDQASLLGEWELTRIDSKPIANAISLDFRTDGQVNGAIECNSFMTDYILNDQRIEFGNAIITAAGCHPRFDANPRLVEKANAVLFSKRPVAMTADGEKLVISGDSVLVFERVS
ncbi:MAG: META domain-containing protein [Erythrobacter sp.]|nr:META domain-containing protein [Erythrobacter sp.]